MELVTNVTFKSNNKSHLFKYGSRGRNWNKTLSDEYYTSEETWKEILEYLNLPLDKIVVNKVFYKGGDYENFEYDKDKIYIDNPPFSKASELAKFYMEREIPFILFCGAGLFYKHNNNICWRKHFYFCDKVFNAEFVDESGNKKLINFSLYSNFKVNKDFNTHL
jgi:hypothetical protein